MNDPQTEGRIRTVLVDALREEGAVGADEEITDETRIMGGGGGLDSMGVVNLVVTLEAGVEQEFGVGVDLFDEAAMEAGRFNTVGSMVAYVAERVETARA